MQFPKDVAVTLADVADLGRLVPHDAPHQGVVIEVEPLEEVWLDGSSGRRAGARRAAGARPGDRPAQCRRDPALGGRVRRDRDRHPGPPFAAGKRRRRQGRVGRARARAVGAGRQPRPGAGRDRRSGLLADRPGRRCRNRSEGRAWPAARRAGARRRRARDCGTTRASIATRWRGCRSATRSRASTFPMPPRSRFMRRASPDGPHGEQHPRACRGAGRARAGLRRVVEQHGMPEPRNSERGAQTLLRTIVGQQVSVAAARSMWAKLEAAFGSPPDLQRLLAASDEELRAAGMSRQKSGYIRSLAAAGHLGRARPREAARRTMRKRSRC